MRPPLGIERDEVHRLSGHQFRRCNWVIEETGVNKVLDAVVAEQPSVLLLSVEPCHNPTGTGASFQ